ncbi:hypothetical protein JYU34_011590 [Plutella xylostella]|uniref:C2H2-type domain-containing protein n=1 Tax=Plutella xylostella TaxID=51655 RepID=A0ABQ7QHS3_PLUXY|nr:hypothetical protein JYU34_011590 [Plutella xylostella]
MKCGGAGGGGGGGGGDELLLGCWLDKEPSPGADLLAELLAPPPLAELKPLPPFTGYTGHLSINGISGRHYGLISQHQPEENNNYPTQSGYHEHEVSSSTAPPAPPAAPAPPPDVKPLLFDKYAADAPDSCAAAAAAASPRKQLYDDPHMDISSIEDIAAIIGSAMADTTSPPDDPEHGDSRESWMDLEAWFGGAQHNEKIIPQDLEEFIPPSPSPQHHSLDFHGKGQDFSKTQELLHKNISQAGLQSLLTHGYMPLLQQRLVHGPPAKHEAPSSTSFGLNEISASSPPGNAVSTTDLGGRYAAHYLGLKPEPACSPERLLGYAHAHTTTPSGKSKRSRAKPKQPQHGGLSYSAAAELGGLLGKEKPVHRCGICNRGFLNKSNIKVHLRTHTGEKPFRCDVCAKAFRQKAHLIKHQQIHKRIGRD